MGAIRLGSSDVHLEPMANYLRIRVRVEGDLVELARIPNPNNMKSSHPFVLQIKARAGMQPYSKHPEDGRLDFEFNGKNLSLRVATIPQVFGEKAVLRIFDVARVQSLNSLGFRPNNLDRLKRMASKGSGMVLVAGPTGSGKTTTLYAVLNHVNNPNRNIVTVEDPVEYFLDGINQIQVEAESLSFETAMRALLRHDPDVIMVGEIRDSITADIAFHAALTGHLVISTLHATDSVGVLSRLLDLRVPPVLVAQGINGIVAQRLVPRLCPVCAVAVLHAPFERIKTYEAQGCNRCHGTGFIGREGVQEVLMLSDRLRKMLTVSLNHDDFRMVAWKEGMQTLKEDGLIKSMEGKVNYRDALAITDEPLERILAEINRLADELGTNVHRG